MGEVISENNAPSINCNILITEEDDLCVAHCLELDLVATGDTPDQARRDCVALICTQIEYAFAHDNLEHLFHPAPSEVWAKFFACKAQVEERFPIEKRLSEPAEQSFLPPWLIAKTCHACHA